MAKTSTVTLQATVSGDGVTNTYVPPGTAITNSSAPDGGPHLVAVTLGANTLTPPTGAAGVIIVPGSVGAITLKGVGGDTGVLLTAARPTFLSLASGQGAFVLAASAADSIQVQWT